MFAASVDSSLVCPRCRHTSVVGNSVQALRKNYAVLALINSNSSANFDVDFTDDDEDEDDEGGEDLRPRRGSQVGRPRAPPAD